MISHLDFNLYQLSILFLFSVFQSKLADQFDLLGMKNNKTKYSTNVMHKSLHDTNFGHSLLFFVIIIEEIFLIAFKNRKN